MYPYIKLSTTLLRSRFRPRLEIEDCASLECRAGITDVDAFMELNHARQILYMELGRWDYSQRVGFVELMRRRRWGITVGGVSIRYRRRVGFLQRFTLTTQAICHDSRWFYFLQEIRRGELLCSSALIKAGAVDGSGLLPAPRVLDALGRGDWDPPTPEWVEAWIEAEGRRPWSGS